MKNRVNIGMLFLGSYLVAGGVNITKDLEAIVIQENDKNIKIERIQDTKHRLTSSFSKTRS